MFVLVFYDVGEKRVSKVLKVARRYLTRIQNSVLEGELTPAQIESLKIDIGKVINPGYDSILFYVWRTERYMDRVVIGIQKEIIDCII